MPVLRILVDTDVLLDVALDRAPHVEAAAAQDVLVPKGLVHPLQPDQCVSVACHGQFW